VTEREVGFEAHLLQEELAARATRSLNVAAAWA